MWLLVSNVVVQHIGCSEFFNACFGAFFFVAWLSARANAAERGNAHKAKQARQLGNQSKQSKGGDDIIFLIVFSWVGGSKKQEAKQAKQGGTKKQEAKQEASKARSKKDKDSRDDFRDDSRDDSRYDSR